MISLFSGESLVTHRTWARPSSEASQADVALSIAKAPRSSHRKILPEEASRNSNIAADSGGIPISAATSGAVHDRAGSRSSSRTISICSSDGSRCCSSSRTRSLMSSDTSRGESRWYTNQNMAVDKIHGAPCAWRCFCSATCRRRHARHARDEAHDLCSHPPYSAAEPHRTLLHFCRHALEAGPALHDAAEKARRLGVADVADRTGDGAGFVWPSLG